LPVTGPRSSLLVFISALGFCLRVFMLLVWWLGRSPGRGDAGVVGLF
jgi:hypothetical protein